MRKIIIPEHAARVLAALNGAGYSAYAVGGCCRDALMGRVPSDWDICTSAPPEDVMRVLPDSVPTGLKHGTVTVTGFGAPVEVTTFRLESGYSDHRRPDSVRFTSDLAADLARRDFTMNAIAAALSGEIFDPFRGREDIERRLIRCVGDAQRRFAEDALRMFRAVRFCAQLDFEPDGDLLSAARELAPTARFVAAERVYAETRKALLSPRPQRLDLGFSLGLYDGFLARPAAPDLAPLADISGGESERFAALCALLLRSRAIGTASGFLCSLRCPARVTRSVSAALDPAPVWERCGSLAEIAAEVGRANAGAAAAAMQAAGVRPHAQAEMDALLRSGRCLSIAELAVGGDELAALGLAGKDIGRCLGLLLRHVLQSPADNEQSILTELAKKYRDGL